MRPITKAAGALLALKALRRYATELTVEQCEVSAHDQAALTALGRVLHRKRTPILELNGVLSTGTIGLRLPPFRATWRVERLTLADGGTVQLTWAELLRGVRYAGRVAVLTGSDVRYPVGLKVGFTELLHDSGPLGR